MNNNNMTNWEEVLNNLPSSYKEWFQEEREYLKDKIQNNENVLEIGCGDGRSIGDIIGITQNITGIDHDQYAINQAKQNFKEIKTINLLKTDAENLPFSNKLFDTVICMTSFANFGEKRNMIIKEAQRVLKNNGKFIISVFSEEALSERLKIYESFEKENKLKILKVLDDGTVEFERPDHTNKLSDNISEQFDKETLEKIFSENGFLIEDIKKVKSKIAYICTFRNSQ